MKTINSDDPIDFIKKINSHCNLMITYSTNTIVSTKLNLA